MCSILSDYDDFWSTVVCLLQSSLLKNYMFFEPKIEEIFNKNSNHGFAISMNNLVPILGVV